jgi:hypothetical protein
MNNQHILDELASSDWYRVTNMLSRLSAEKEATPSPEVFQQMIDLMSDSDPDIRNLAVFAAGLHWQHRPALPRIIAILNDVEENPLVLTCAANALGTIAHNDETIRDRAVRELAKVAVNNRMSQDVRDAAYTSALWAAHRLTPSEYAAERSIPQDQNDADWAWLTSMLRDTRNA